MLQWQDELDGDGVYLSNLKQKPGELTRQLGITVIIVFYGRVYLMGWIPVQSYPLDVYLTMAAGWDLFTKVGTVIDARKLLDELRVDVK